MALMGNKKNTKETKITKDTDVIEINAQMQGSLVFKDPVNLKINGNFRGSLITTGILTIGESAIVESNIEGDNVIIAGKVTGKITANKMLVLMPTSSLIGDIITPKLNIVEGAIFQGNCQMTSMKSDNNFISLSDVASYMEIDEEEIEELAASGKIPASKEGSTWKFDKTEIDAWAAAQVN